jgi:hypothetical protein
VSYCLNSSSRNFSLSLIFSSNSRTVSAAEFTLAFDYFSAC